MRMANVSTLRRDWFGSLAVMVMRLLTDDMADWFAKMGLGGAYGRWLGGEPDSRAWSWKGFDTERRRSSPAS
jgi:hypothetical protein